MCNSYWLLPVLSLGLMTLFAYLHWSNRYDLRTMRTPCSDQKEAIRGHNERIYRDFEFFVKIFMALVGGMGYIRLGPYSGAEHIARYAMKGIGCLGFLTMLALGFFITCHQGSKIYRWTDYVGESYKDSRVLMTILPKCFRGDASFVGWIVPKFLHWQETWMLCAMFLMAAGLWVFACHW